MLQLFACVPTYAESPGMADHLSLVGAVLASWMECTYAPDGQATSMVQIGEPISVIRIEVGPDQEVSLRTGQQRRNFGAAGCGQQGLVPQVADARVAPLFDIYEGSPHHLV